MWVHEAGAVVSVCVTQGLRSGLHTNPPGVVLSQMSRLHHCLEASIACCLSVVQNLVLCVGCSMLLCCVRTSWSPTAHPAQPRVVAQLVAPDVRQVLVVQTLPKIQL